MKQLFDLAAVAETWRRVWGDGKMFRGPRFPSYVFSKKKPFSRPKFLMTFLVIDQVFRIIPFFSQIFRIFYFPHKNKHYFRKEFFYDTFCYSVRTFARIRQHYFSKYWGDGCMGRPPPQILGGPPVP